MGIDLTGRTSGEAETACSMKRDEIGTVARHQDGRKRGDKAMTTTLHVALRTCPEYITREAEILLARLGELAPDSDTVSLKLSRNGMFYSSDMSIEFPGKSITANSQSRYLNEALEDSFLDIFLKARTFGRYRLENGKIRPLSGTSR